MIFITKWKARKKDKQAALQKERENTLKRFDEALEEAAKIAEPDKKAIALKGIEQEIANEISETNIKNSREADKKGALAMTKSALSSIGGAAAIFGGFLLAAPLSGIAVMVAIAVVMAVGSTAAFSPLVNNKVYKSTYKRLTQDSQNFCNKLNEKKLAAAALAEKAVAENTQVIAGSSQRDRIFALPGLMAAYAKATADKEAGNDNQPDAAATPNTAANNGPSL